MSLAEEVRKQNNTASEVEKLLKERCPLIGWHVRRASVTGAENQDLRFYLADYSTTIETLVGGQRLTGMVPENVEIAPIDELVDDIIDHSTYEIAKAIRNWRPQPETRSKEGE